VRGLWHDGSLPDSIPGARLDRALADPAGAAAIIAESAQTAFR
jgi:hypothetical protein